MTEKAWYNNEVSSGPAELQHSLNIVDSVLSQNGYPSPRSYSSFG